MSYYVVSSAKEEADRKRRNAARKAGVVRKTFVNLSEKGEGVIARVPYGNEVARISIENGRFVVALETKDMRSESATGEILGSFLSERLLSTAPAGVVPINAVVQGQTVPCGVCVLVGAAGVGKTPTAHALAASIADTYGLVRIGEPFTGYSSSQADAVTALAAAMCAHEAVVVDSIKDLLSTGGALMKGGLSRNALLDLSTWSILAAHMGTTLFVPLNPSSPDPEIIALLVEAARSNTTMTLAYSDKEEWVGMARTGEGMERDSLRFSFKRGDGPWNQGNAKSPSTGTPTAIRLSGAEFNELLRRAAM